MKILLSFIAVCFVFAVNSQTLYWVGGSGNWNDANHWSHTSGGVPSRLIPNAQTNVVFDNNSAIHPIVIRVQQSFEIKSLQSFNNINSIDLISAPLVNIKINGIVELTPQFNYKISGTTTLSPSASSKYQFANTKFVNDIVISTNNSIELGAINSSANIVFKGKIKLSNSSIIANQVSFINSQIDLENIIIKSENGYKIINTNILSNTQRPSKFITPSSKFSSLESNYLKGITGLNLKVAAFCTPGLQVNSPTCSNICDGQIIVDLSGCGDPPYTIELDQGSCPATSAYTVSGIMTSSYTFSNICGCAYPYGIYTTNSLSQLSYTSTSVTNPAPTVMAFSTINQPSCFGYCDGRIKATKLSGNSPLQIDWGNGIIHSGIVTIDTLKSACAGNYPVTITNNFGCQNTFTPTLTEPTALLANGSTSSITCGGICTGAGTVSPSGGTAPYTITWSAGAPGTGNTTSGLCAGTVTASVTDSRACPVTFTANIIQPPILTLSVNKTNISCGGYSDGSATITATGGTPPFTYILNPAGTPTTSIITGLIAGTYSVDVTDAQGCVRTATFTLTEPIPLITTPSSTNLACSGVCAGAINLNASGGTPGYSYVWSPVGPNLPSRTNLCSGLYSYTVTDALGCITSGNVNLTQPSATTLTITKTDVVCFNACNGTALVTPGGGTGPYTYTWSPVPPSGQGTANITNLCPGTFTLNALDMNGCASSTNVSITQPSIITANISTVSPTCFGLNNGSISASPTGGTGGYTYTLQTSTFTTTTNPTFSGLYADSYTLYVQDANGCTSTNTINLTQPNQISLALNSSSINCANQCNASISSVVSGGFPTYTFLWSTGATAASLNNQCAGVYNATVTDSRGCFTTSSVTVNSPPPLSVTISPIPPSCSGSCNGFAAVTVSGGTPNYSYFWPSGGTTGSTKANLCQGTYSVIITDNLACTTIASVAIVAPNTLTLTTTSGTVSCSGMCNGTVGVVVTGGTPGYSYSWNSFPPQTTAVASSLCAGNYNVSVTDNSGCIAFSSASVSQPSPLTAVVGNVVPSCNICIGAATVTPSGATPAYSYTWTNSSNVGVANTQAASNLCADFYTVTIADANNCTTTTTLEVTQSVILILTSSGTPLQCNGACTGIAMANPLGGNTPYTYSWSPTVSTQTAATATGLCSGTYSVLVTDFLGCSNTGTISFIDPPATTVTVNQTDITCNSLCNGTASVSVVGGTGMHTYRWLPGGQTTSTISGLCAGVYSIDVTDANGCITSQTFQITEPTVMTATYVAALPSACTNNDGSITAFISGGTPAYTFTWFPGGSTGNPLTNISAGTYTLGVLDAAGCTQTLVTTLSDPIGPTLSIGSNSISCSGLCDGSATVTATGAGPLSYNWTSGSTPTNSTTANLCAGVVAVTITDINSCVTGTMVTITQPSSLTVNGIITDVRCNPACSGSVNLTPSGGVTPYIYDWQPIGVTIQDPIGLCAGSYTNITQDNNGCIVTSEFIVSQPSASLALSFNKRDVLCNGGCTGSVRAVVSGGVGPYAYSWAPSAPFSGSILDTIVNLCTGTYSVRVTDAFGCTISGTVNIGQPLALTTSANSTSITCNGICDGFANINPSGGTLPYSYNWNTTPASLTQTIGGLCIGNYRGLVTDANGCTSSKTVTISQPTAISVTVTATNPKCNSVCNGSFVTAVSGGNPTYSYQWIPVASPIGTMPNPTGLCAGSYTLIVTDNNSCSSQVLRTLTDPVPLTSNVSYTNPVCNGGCNGRASVSPAGGSSPYTYLWASPSRTTQTITNLCSGTYTVVISDVNLCTNTQTIALTDPALITLNPAVTPATCGQSNGSIDASAVSGLAPYTYSWSAPVPGGSATFTIVTGLAAGIYTVVIRDANTCTISASIPLSNSNGPSGATITTTNTICHGDCNGSATISNPVGGTPSYTLSWTTPLSSNSTVSGLCAGTYVARVVDANNCLLFISPVITEPQAIDDNEVLTSATCYGTCDGEAILNPSGGNGGYTYLWNTGATTSTLGSLCPDSYSVTVTDNLGCTLSANYNLPSLITITSNTFAIDNICFGECDGSLSVTNLAGGLPPYTLLWNDPLGQNTSSAINLCNGNYSVAISDANGCLGENFGAIASFAEISPNPTVVGPDCGLCDGTASLSPTGGSGVYTFVWTNNQTSNSVTNLCAGIYGVDITDDQGCATSTNVIVNNSSGISSEIITKVDETCAGYCNATVTIAAVGGTSPITYNWPHNGSSSQIQTGLCAGTYFCNMTDVNGCVRTASVVIGAAVTLSISSQVNQTSCSVNTGSITVSVLGGSGSYTYAWLPSGNTATVSGLGAGIYTLTVTDTNSCSNTQAYTINSINGPVLSLNTTNADCISMVTCNGSASVTITGGTPTYTTHWSTGSSSNTVSSLCTGSYSLMVTDNLGCITIQTFSISSSTPVVFSAPNLHDPSCNNDCNGSITAIPSGGSLPYTYSWSPANVTTASTASLCAGTQTLVITDSRGCIASQSYTLVNPAVLQLSAAVSNPTCNTVPSGTIDITVTGGTPVYNYSWTGAVNAGTEDLNNTSIGTFSLLITDSNGCEKDTLIVLNSPIFVDAIVGNDTTFCEGGLFTLNGSNSIGGVANNWYLSPSSTPISNTLVASVILSSGTSTFVLVVADGTCMDTDSIVVTSNPLPLVDAGTSVDIPLYSTTQIGGNPTGPSGSTYTWSPNFGTIDLPNESNPTVSNTITTTYTVVVTDLNGCNNSDTISVNVYSAVSISTGFSPNGDGKNDFWQIDNISQFSDNVVEVYNRWGELLFTSKGYSVPFDGKYKGKDLPVGSYYYIINLNHPSFPNPYTGPLTIFR